MRVLLIKMSSLGDVVHALAPISDAIRANPQIQFDWVVEEAYQEVARRLGILPEGDARDLKAPSLLQ